jgi:hypothetical protein
LKKSIISEAKPVLLKESIDWVGITEEEVNLILRKEIFQAIRDRRTKDLNILGLRRRIQIEQVSEPGAPCVYLLMEEEKQDIGFVVYVYQAIFDGDQLRLAADEIWRYDK